LESRQNPQRRVHALLGKPDERKTRQLKKDATANLMKFYTQLNFWQLPIFYTPLGYWSFAKSLSICVNVSADF
jgi:hypothetical protein